jgi:peptide/nickel transport system substrate-binding protein
MKHTRKVPIVVLSAAALTLTACAQSDRDSGNTASSGTASNVKDTFTFGAAGAPKLFDPFYATDGSTLTMRFEHPPGTVDYMTGDGPLLFAGCPG